MLYILYEIYTTYIKNKKNVTLMFLAEIIVVEYNYRSTIYLAPTKLIAIYYIR